MLKKAGNLSKNEINFRFKHLKSILVIFMIVSTVIFIICCCNETNFIAGSNPYTPASPSGNTTGEKNVDHEYVIYTIDVGSSWIFDWGDGNLSDWVKVGESDTFISQTYSWQSYGVFEVRVKQKSVYSMESEWSLPLIVTISPSPDRDNDGWNNEIEEAYGKDPEDSTDYPLDTDGDWIPDDDSLDGNYTGDTNDDNDGLSDALEETLGSNPKNNGDVITLIIKETSYHLIDKNGDGNSDILYNSQTGRQTKVSIENSITYIDIDGDGSWDYTYDVSVQRYEPFPWLYVIIGIILTVLIVIFLLFRTGILYIYEEEYIVRK